MPALGACPLKCLGHARSWDMPFRDVAVGFAEYRAKRYLELLALASTCNFGSISLKESDLDASWSIWPVPANTATGLKRFAPTAYNEVLQCQALRLLARILHSMGNRVTLCMLSALVCFERKESSGVMAMITFHKNMPSDRCMRRWRL